MTIYDLLWKRPDSKSEKVRWEKVGILMEKDDGKKSVKIDLVPVGQWDGVGLWYPKEEPKRNPQKSRRSAANWNHFKNHRAGLSLSLQQGASA